MPQLTIAEVQQKTTKGGKPYLSVKSTGNKWYYVWQDAEYIWHLIKEGATIEPILATQGNFTSITGVIGVEPPNASGGITVAANRPVATSGALTAWDKMFEQMNRIEKKLDDVIAINVPPHN